MRPKPCFVREVRRRNAFAYTAVNDCGNRFLLVNRQGVIAYRLKFIQRQFQRMQNKVHRFVKRIRHAVAERQAGRAQSLLRHIHCFTQRCQWW